MGFLDIAPTVLSSRYLGEKKDIFISLFPHACASFKIKIKKNIGKQKRFFKLHSKTVYYVKNPIQAFVNIKAKSETHEGLFLICTFFGICYFLKSSLRLN